MRDSPICDYVFLAYVGIPYIMHAPMVLFLRYRPKMKVRFICLGSKVVREICSLGTRLFTALSVSHGGLLLQVERSAKVLSSFSPIIEEISGSNDATIETLLFSEPFHAEYSTTGIVTKISR